MYLFDLYSVTIETDKLLRGQWATRKHINSIEITLLLNQTYVVDFKLHFFMLKVKIEQNRM